MNIKVMSETTEKVSAAKSFTAWDWVIMVAYMLLMLGVGFYFYWQSKKDKSFGSNQYLTAKGMKIPAIVVGLSIWATALSSITFLAVPGLAFKTGWMWSAAQITFLVIAPYLIKFVIPFYRRIKGSTAYVYLEQRFNYSLRAVGSISFILFHIFRIAVVLYIPTLALSLFIDINVYLILFVVAVVVVVGTFLGGFKGVMWTDAIQGVVFLVGIILILIFGLWGTDWNNAKYQRIFNEEQWKITLASGGMFFIFVSKYIESLFSYTASQDIVQRYKAGKTIVTVNKSIYINIILTVITILVFYGAGSVLYSYYSSQGIDVDAKNAIDQIVGIKKAANNQLLAYFIITVLPTGISGLLISAIFAASQSTISSSLNSLTTSLITDFITRFKKMKDNKILFLSKVFTAIFGIFGFAVACLIVATNQQNLISYFLGVVGLLGSPLAALFMLGILTKKTNWQGALTGIIVSMMISLPIWVSTSVTKTLVFASEWSVLVSFFTTMFIGYGSSFVYAMFFKDQKDLTNLTIHTKTEDFDKLLKIEKNLAKFESFFNKNKKMSKEEKSDLISQYEKLEKVVENQTI